MTQEAVKEIVNSQIRRIVRLVGMVIVIVMFVSLSVKYSVS